MTDDCYIYSGPSMRPTLRPGSRLWVRPAAGDLAPGDVIVFTAPSGQVTVHRIIACTPAGYLTRGDANPQPDRLPVTPAQVLGRVEHSAAGPHPRPVTGGRRGLLAARLRWLACDGWAWLLSRAWLAGPLGRGYARLRRSPHLRRALGRLLAPHLQTVRVETPAGPLVKTLYRGRVVARYCPGCGRYAVRKPFDLVIEMREGPTP